MLIPDVNVLVGALRPDSPFHDVLRPWLAEAVAGEQPVGFPDVAVSGFLRVVSHPRIFDPPTEMTVAATAVDSLLSAGCLWVASSERHWSILKGLLVSAKARGNLVSGAHLAAISIEHGATLVSADRNFARFPGLSWVDPLS